LRAVAGRSIDLCEALFHDQSGVSEGSTTEDVGARLKRLRLDRGLSQRDLSSPGVSYAYISRIEAGARTPSVKALRKLAQRLNVSVEYLETGRDTRDVDERELRLADAELDLRLGGDIAGAEAKLAAVLDEAVAAGDPASANRARIALGLAAARRGDQLEAVERLEAALGSSRDVAHPHTRPELYTTLGRSYTALGAADRAVALFGRCLGQVAEAVPEDSTARIRYASLLSLALRDAGEPERASAVLRDALAQLDEQGGPYSRARSYQLVARASAEAGERSEALDYVRDANALLRAAEDDQTLARAYLLGARVELHDGNAAAARRQLEHAQSFLGRTPARGDEAMLRICESRLAALDGDAERAVEAARAALKLLGDFNGDTRGAAALALAKGLELQGDDDGADAAYRRAVDLLGAHGPGADAGEAALEWASSLRRRGRGKEAESVFRRAYDLGVHAETEAARRR
jgi:transcriptional regulator with XRE-family HTH domain